MIVFSVMCSTQHLGFVVTGKQVDIMGNDPLDLLHNKHITKLISFFAVAKLISNGMQSQSAPNTITIIL
jgi:hypothetical protein